MTDVAAIRTKFEALRPFLDERRRRLWAATEALALGRGGVTAVAAATALRRNTLHAGIRELQARASMAVAPPAPPAPEQRVRAPGGGRKALTARDPTLLSDLEALVEPLTRGDPESPLRWTCKGTRKTTEGATHPDRDAQFAHINAQTHAFQERGQPVISVDTKKKELVGDFTNGGREWRPAGHPEPVRVHDFIDRVLGKA